MSASETEDKPKRALISWETKHSVLVVYKGRFFQLFKVGKGEEKKVSPWACWKHERFCGKVLKRPHLTCFSCRIRRVIVKEIPPIFEVTPYIILIPRKRGKLKAFLGKKFCTLAEKFNR